MKKKKSFKSTIEENWILWAMLVPATVSIILFAYLPIFGIVVAFQDFDIMKGFFGSPFVGLDNFRRIASDPMMGNIIRNTVGLSSIKLAISFPLPIVFALLLNELRSIKYKRLVQTISYLPHFVSWVIVIGIFMKLIAYEDGVVNLAMEKMGMERINFAIQSWFMWPLAIFTSVWKEIGWSAIIYLAALTSIDPQLYEAATVDGASRWKQMLHVTLPGIKSTIVILLILEIPSIVSSNRDQMWVLGTLPVRDVTEVIDTYVLRQGLSNMEYSMATAVGLVKSAISLILIISVNAIARRLGEEGVF